MAAEGAAGDAGESPAQPPGGRGSLVAALSSMWSALVLGLLAAIFAWFWFGGSGESERSEQQEGEEKTVTGDCLEDQMPVCEVKEQILSSVQEQVLEASSSKETVQNFPVVQETGYKQGALDKTFQVAESVDSLQGSEFPRPGSLGVHTYELIEAKEQGIAKESMTNLQLTCTDGQKERGHLGQPLGRELANWEQDVNHPTAVNSVGLQANESELEHPSSNVSSEEVAQFGLDETEAKSPEGDGKIKQVAAISPMLQNVQVKFKVHYITHSDSQLIAVTGDHTDLGMWEAYIPLKCDKDGFWSNSVALPIDTRMTWKFVLVENGKIKRWEECSNRSLETEHDDKEVHQWWGH